MEEHNRPILSIKRKPSLMYQKPPQKPESEQNVAQPEQTVTASSTKAKPKYKAPPEQEVVMFWYVEQLQDLNSLGAKFVLASPTEADGAVIPARTMLATPDGFPSIGKLSR